MGNRMLSQLSEKERNEIHDVCNRLTDFLFEYFRDYPIFNPIRFQAVSLTSAAENPFISMGKLENRVKITIWIFAIDDLIDEKMIPENELKEKLDFYKKVVLGEAHEVDPKDQCGSVLLDIVKQIQSRPLYADLKDLWEQSFLKMITGMLLEAHEAPLNIGLEKYLDHSAYSVGVPMYVISAWILTEEQSKLHHRDELEELMMLSSKSIRLANDLRTYEKEKKENNLNAIMIKERELINLGLDEQTAHAEAFHYIESLLKSYMEQFYSKCDDSIPLKKALHRLTRFSLDFYSETDFDKASEEQIRNM